MDPKRSASVSQQQVHLRIKVKYLLVLLVCYTMIEIRSWNIFSILQYNLKVLSFYSFHLTDLEYIL